MAVSHHDSQGLGGIIFTNCKQDKYFLPLPETACVLIHASLLSCSEAPGEFRMSLQMCTKPAARYDISGCRERMNSLKTSLHCISAVDPRIALSFLPDH